MTDFGKGDHTPLGEDEKTAALEWARKKRAEYGVIADRTADDPIGPVPEVEDEIAARALLDAVRLIREHEYVGLDLDDSRWCDECGLTPPLGHDPSCEVGSWVRAAQKAGVE